MWVVINNGKIIWLPYELYAVDVPMTGWLKHQRLMRQVKGASDRIVTAIKVHRKREHVGRVQVNVPMGYALSSLSKFSKLRYNYGRQLALLIDTELN